MKLLKVFRMFAAGFVLAMATGSWAAEPVRIGMSMARTGAFAAAGAGQLNAYQLWAEQVNAAGGLDVAGTRRPVQLVVYDDQSDPAKAAAIYEKLITSDKVDLLLSPWGSPAHFAVVGVLERYKFPMVGSSAASLQIRSLKARNIWFPTSAIPDALGAELAKMMQAQGVKSVAINTVQLPFPQEIKRFLVPAVQAAGIKVVHDEEYAPGIKDMTASMVAIKRAAPDAVVSLSYPEDSMLYMKQAREQDIRAPFQFVAVGPSIAFFSKMFGANLDNIVTLGHWSPDQKAWPKAKPFFDAYQAKYGEAPDYLDVALAWVSAEILQQAVAKAGLDKDKLRAAIASGTFDTIDGPVAFDGVQNRLTPAMFLQFQQGKGQIVYPPSQQTTPFVAKSGWQK
ncbi:amino acid ABC transporter substrate-binding protein [Variovorax saccharolyticus]|uniref:amino acid ABC transporter substrate-binding protein n=1 Tax=Variovorax saccharolyticus TaxID=3053516 RepID=UPI0025761E22|nr:amino acid ABC transporter substrate-binding protein [Variovorax sp. J22R187]MDM0020919.1 amino acid ABC transporter substrate-binding protein [Variovorax sp. J22R187]